MFKPKHIPPAGVKQIYNKFLQQVEAAEMEAWVNYQRCVASRKAVEEDLARMISGDQPAEGEIRPVPE